MKESLIHTNDIRKALKGIEKAYDPVNSILIVRGMGMPLHESVIRFASQFLTRAARNNFLDRQESDMIQLSTETHMLAGKTNDSPKKVEFWEKFSDACYLFQDTNSTTTSVPTVVFEVGFSESYEDLLSDMRQWRTTSQGRQVTNKSACVPVSMGFDRW